MAQIIGAEVNKDDCENVKRVVSKYGYQIVCDEEEEKKQEADIILPSGEECDSIVKVASKVGVSVVCDENAE